MPMTKVYLRKGRTAEEKAAISEAVHQSLVQVLGIPDDDRFHVFHELDDENLVTAPTMFGIERRHGMLFIQFCFGQRSAATLRRLYEVVVAHLGERAGVEARDVIINLVPSPSENWWVEGRVLDPTTGFDERIAADRLPGGGTEEIGVERVGGSTG